VRPILSLLAGAAVAVLGAAVLGEYAFSGPAVVGSGIVLGLFVAEAVVSVARSGSGPGAAAGAVLTAAAMTWAGWISTGHRLGTVRWEGWLAVAAGAAVAAFRARPPAAARRSRRATASAE
jgi:hypothetical protein